MTSPQSIIDLDDLLALAQTGFTLRRVTWEEAQPWGLRGGFLAHHSGGFFSVAGVEFLEGPEQNGVFLYQPQSALTGLLTTRFAGEPHALLQARVEPGTWGVAQFGPTVQSTPANYQRAHGGHSSPYFSQFATSSLSVSPYGDTVQLDLGERYWMKSKRLILAECTPDLPVQPGFVWVSFALLRQGVLNNTFFNIDLRSLLAVMSWDAGHLSPQSPDVCRSLATRVRGDVLGGLLARIRGTPRRARFVALEALENWRISPGGLAEKHRRQGFDIELFEVEAQWREVSKWVQPMVVTATRGHAVLLCRLGAAGLEVLVRVGNELGLQTGSALLPTYLKYPGCTVDSRIAAIDWESLPLIAGTLESDEGGRFYHNLSRYELRWCKEHSPLGESADHAWIRISELKAALLQSNCCSIQLRALASMLIGCSLS
jgi:oxidase EvaA